MTDQEAQKLTIEDLGTRKDGQYRVAESTLVKQLRTAAALQQPYQPGRANVPTALGSTP